LTVTDKQTIRKKTQHKSQNTHTNTIQIKENKQLSIQQKQNYPDSVASYDTQPENEVGLLYNGPEHHMGRIISDLYLFVMSHCLYDIMSALNVYMYALHV